MRKVFWDHLVKIDEIHIKIDSHGFTKDENEGTTSTILPYRFATLRDLTIGSVQTTKSLAEILREGTLLERVRRMNRNKPVFA